ncbi:hypothetical protein ACFQ5J_07655 [Lacticaseibacillus baoqingensis]|uniref:Lipoprotein n=1 Tax=Lacticaseibacillus baoqingensis TaxID=2486013 RepID=A0ABW4E5C1_9LACO|nr:hypothetical protein [Lacticaseibacillus baoqingensis]
MGKRAWWLLGLVGVLAVGVSACGQPAAKAKPAANSSVSQAAVAKAKSTTSSVAAPTRQPSASEQIALLLLADGAQAWSPTGQQLLAKETQDTATPATGYATEAPANAKVYTLRQEHKDLTPLVVITGDQAYLLASQSAVPYAYIQQHGFRVNWHDLWQKYYQSADVAKLAALIPIAADTPDVSKNGISSDPQTALAQAKGEYIEDDSTVSDGSAQRTSFFEQDGALMWEAHHEGDGAMQYEFDLSALTYAGPDNAGGQLFSGNGVEYSGHQVPLTIDIINDQTYTLKSTAINYYGMFNRKE